jgi:nitrous oxide reductase accessory protein NosL
MRKPLRTGLLLLFLVAACASGEFAPVPIEEGDMCSFCRMAISEKQFAAEIITDDATLKFDDVGCMLRYRQAAADKLDRAAIFVTDNVSREWLKAESAFFVRSKTIKTPMGSGIVAFGDRSRAGSDAATFDALSLSGK